MLRFWLIFCAVAMAVGGSVQAGLLGVGRSGGGRSAGGGSTPIVDVNFSGEAVRFQTIPSRSPNFVQGDTWYSTWGDDGKVYITANDGSIGYGALQHIMLFTLQGWGASGTSLTLVPPNTLGGLWGWNNIPLVNNEGYKSGGIICLPASVPPVTPMGKFYLLTRMIDQVAWRWFANTQLIKSHDHGVTWTPEPTAVNQPYENPMWPGVLGAGFFVQYGQCYEGAGPHRSNEFVYAGIENNSFGWMAESAVEEVHLGRVPIGKIDDLNVADWQYYQGGDGMDDKNWASCVPTATGLQATPCFSTAVKILNGPSFRAPDEVGTHYGGIQYLPAFKQYFYVGQRNLYGRTPPNLSINFFMAPAPWGPWTLYRQVMSPTVKEAWQNVIQPSMVNGGESFTVATSGSPNTEHYVPMFRPVRVTMRFMGN